LIPFLAEALAAISIAAASTGALPAVLSSAGIPPAAVGVDIPSAAAVEGIAALESVQSNPGSHGRVPGLEPLVPEVAGGTFSISPGPRPYGRRLALSPAFGRLGREDLYALRLAYNPDAWLGYEVSIGHNPGRSVHALVHILSALLRYPVPFRGQPYASVGYGMVLVFPGQSVNADPVTENVLSLGGGLETFLRDDVAIRIEGKRLFVPGDDPSGGSAVYEYAELSVGLSFYRLVAD